MREGKALDEVDTITLPPLDEATLLAEDLDAGALGAPLRVAVARPLPVSVEKNGTWETRPGGGKMWRLRIQSPGAVWLSFGFRHYKMPQGGRLLVYSPDHAHVVGPFTVADNEQHGQLWTPMLPGDDAIIEVTLPDAKAADLTLELAQVNHGYRGPEDGPGPSAACNVDVACTDGDGWREQIRSVAHYHISGPGGTYLCTGALVNNAAAGSDPAVADCRPLQ